MDSPEQLPMDLPVVDLGLWLSKDTPDAVALAECRKASQAMIDYGALILHDPRVSEDDNTAFLDLLEDYFAQPTEALKKDERPELGYQVGVTLENTEKPKCAVDGPCLDVIQRLDPSQRPLDISGHSPDPKCRFFWRMAKPPPYTTEFPGLNAPNVVPEAPPIKERWTPIMDKWGTSMRNAVETLCEALAVGLRLPKQTFSHAGRFGPHLLAPTASDLDKYGDKDTILAGFHTDLNFLTIHGRSRYPGLNIWARNTGRRIPVKMPPGNYLLVQAGKQLEHLTGGLVKAGYHEVVVNDQTIGAMEKRKRDSPDRPLVRISSTLFWHLSSDFDLAPIAELSRQRRDVLGEGPSPEYPPIKVGHQVQNELRHIALMEQ